MFEMLTGKTPFYETHQIKDALTYGLGSETLPLENVTCHPGFSDKVKEFLRLCIIW